VALTIRRETAMTLQLTTCPECGAPADVTDEGSVDSTDGPVRVVRVHCARRHWFLMDGDGLPSPASDIAEVTVRA
jgi:hypothetical protein